MLLTRLLPYRILRYYHQNLPRGAPGLQNDTVSFPYSLSLLSSSHIAIITDYAITVLELKTTRLGLFWNYSIDSTYIIWSISGNYIQVSIMRSDLQVCNYSKFFPKRAQQGQGDFSFMYEESGMLCFYYV